MEIVANELIGDGPESFILIASGWTNGGYRMYHLIYETPNDGDMSYKHIFHERTTMITLYPFIKTSIIEYEEINENENENEFGIFPVIF